MAGSSYDCNQVVLRWAKFNSNAPEKIIIATASSRLFQESYFKTVTDKYFGPDSKYLEERKSDFRNLVREGRDDDAKKLRNEVAYDLISISDYLFSEVRDGLFIRRASIDSGSRFYNLLFTTASTVSSVESVKTAFSGCYFFNGNKSNF